MADAAVYGFSFPATIVASAWRSYLERLRTDPLLTKSLTAAVVSVFSDVFARRMTNTPVRSSAALNELTIGLLLRGPVVHAFHEYLDSVLFKHADHSAIPVVVGKLAIDQFLFSPLFTILYLFVRALAEDASFAQTTKQIRTELVGIMRSSWVVWIPANFVTYLLIPLELRALFGNVVAFFWNAYLIAVTSPTPAASS